MKKKKLICVLGETGSGKDTITNLCIEKYLPEYKKVVSYTTREKRSNETDGVEHYFVTDEEYDKIHETNDIIAETKIGNIKYMATLEELMKSNFYIIDPKGLITLRNYIEKNNVPIKIEAVYIYASLETRDSRARIRSDYETSFKKRVDSESQQFKEFIQNKLYDHIIINDCTEDIVYEETNSDKILNQSVLQLFFISQ